MHVLAGERRDRLRLTKAGLISESAHQWYTTDGAGGDEIAHTRKSAKMWLGGWTQTLCTVRTDEVAGLDALRLFKFNTAGVTPPSQVPRLIFISILGSPSQVRISMTRKIQGTHGREPPEA